MHSHQQFCVNALAARNRHTHTHTVKTTGSDTTLMATRNPANQLMICSLSQYLRWVFFAPSKRWLALGFLVAINSTTLKWGKSSPQNSWDFTEVFRSTACECGDASLKKRWDLCVSFGLLMGLWVFFLHPSSSLKNVTIIYWNLEFYSTTFFGDSGRTCGSFLSYPSRRVSFFKVPTCLKQQRSSRRGVVERNVSCEFCMVFCIQKNNIIWHGQSFGENLQIPSSIWKLSKTRAGSAMEYTTRDGGTIRHWFDQLHNISWWNKTGALKTWHGMV